MKRHYYAAQSPRGFANEIEIHRFPTRVNRDLWVGKHRHDGDVNSGYQGAHAVTAREARHILAYHGDAVTESYHSIVDHTPVPWQIVPLTDACGDGISEGSDPDRIKALREFQTTGGMDRVFFTYPEDGQEWLDSSDWGPTPDGIDWTDFPKP